MTLSEIRRAAQSGPVSARVHVQVESAGPKLTREQKPYCELSLADACDRMTLRVWSDHPAYKACSALNSESFIELTGEFNSHSQYGLEAQKWTVRPLTAQEKDELLQGPAELRAKHNADWQFIVETIATITDPRLRALCDAFVKDLGERFRRTAAARNYHHARRGGLVEHTAQMMRIANVMGYDERGELLGHISIGLELVNSLWRKVSADNGDAWKSLTPPSEDVRLHLLHLIGAHHGEAQFGSPVSPKTPEAMALHYIDNLDARLEMFAAGYTTAKPLAGRIFDRVRPLPANLVAPLEKFQAPAGRQKSDDQLF